MSKAESTLVQRPLGRGDICVCAAGRDVVRITVPTPQSDMTAREAIFLAAALIRAAQSAEL